MPEIAWSPWGSRPQALAQTGQFLGSARPGQPRAQWRDGFSDPSPHVTEIMFDPVTRQALVGVSYENGGCLADDSIYHATIELDSAVIRAARARPTVAYEAARRELATLEGYDGY